MPEFHVDIGPQYEGERVRKEDLYVEFGGPKVENKAELVVMKGLDEVDNEKVEVIGPDISDMEEGGSYPLFVEVFVAGEQLEKDMEP
ncbi:MAG: acetyl-CoA decarbonylase/synthase complex subunit beta, partial [Deltaproteobacteria bacterium]